GGEVFHAHAELERNIPFLRHRADESRLQIAAMDDPIRCAIALRRRLAERDAYDLPPAASRKHANARRCDDVGTQPIAEPEIEQETRGIGRELNAGAGFFEPP